MYKVYGGFKTSYKNVRDYLSGPVNESGNSWYSIVFKEPGYQFVNYLGSEYEIFFPRIIFGIQAYLNLEYAVELKSHRFKYSCRIKQIGLIKPKTPVLRTKVYSVPLVNLMAEGTEPCYIASEEQSMPYLSRGEPKKRTKFVLESFEELSDLNIHQMSSRAIADFWAGELNNDSDLEEVKSWQDFSQEANGERELDYYSHSSHKIKEFRQNIFKLMSSFTNDDSKKYFTENPYQYKSTFKSFVNDLTYNHRYNHRYFGGKYNLVETVGKELHKELK